MHLRQLLLPANWTNTGEDCCDNVGSDGTVNGIVTVVTGTTNVTNANFGIEQLPNSGFNIQPTQPNPGGTTLVTVPAAAFSGTDPDGGTITAIRITAFPADVTSIVINGTILYGSHFSCWWRNSANKCNRTADTNITVDPANADRVVVIHYVTIDNAGKEDPTPGSVTYHLTTNGSKR